jgi:PAS domain S-box-containing protein
MEQIHSLLKRQIKRHFSKLDSLPKEWQGLLDAVNEAYWEFDADRSTLERSLDMSSQELLQANSEMRAAFRAFPDLFFRLDTDGTILDYKAGITTDLYLPPEKLLGKRIQDIPLKGGGNKFHEAILQVQKTNSLVSIEYSLKMEERENFYEARLLPLFENQVIVIVRNITERKRAEEALRKSEHLYRSFIELTNTVAWATNADGKVVEDIPTWRKYTGQSYEEIEGYGWSKALHPDDVERALQVWKKAVETKSAYETEYRIRRYDGVYRDFLARGIPVFKEDGTIQEWVGTCIDITERKQAEEALRESEVKYRTLVENIPQKIFFKNKDSVYISCNENYARDLKIKPNEIAGKTDYDFYPKDLAGKYIEDDKRIIESGITEDIEERYIQDGQEIWVHTVKTPVKDENGDVIGILGVFWDTTEHKRAEEALKESEERLKQVVEGAELGTWDQNMKTGEVIRNRRWAEMLGYTLEEIKPHTDAWKALIHPDDLPEVNRITQDHRAGRTPFLKCEHRIRTKSGEWKWILNCGKIIERDKDGKPIRAVGIHTDITERKRAEEALRERQEKYSAIVEKGNDGIIIIKDGLLKFANSTISTITGFTPEEAFEKPFVNFVSPAYRELVTKMYKRRMSGEELPSRYETEILSKDGKSIPVEISASVIEYEGKPADMAIIRDITERKKAEQALQESEEKYSTIVERGNDGIIIIQDGLLKFVNTPLTIITGLTPEETIGKQFLDLVSPTYREMVSDRYKKRISGEEPPNRYEIEILSKDGKKIPVEISATLIEYEGRPADMAIIRDITERKVMEQALLRSEKKYRTLVESAHEGIGLVDIEENLTLVNQAFADALGYKKEELLGLNLSRLCDVDQFAKFRRETGKRIQGESSRYDARLYTKAGEPKDFSLSAAPLYDENGSFVGTLGLLADITESKRAEKLLRTSEAQLSNAMKIAKLGYWEYDVAKDLFTFNDHFYAIFRTTVEQVGGYTMSSARYAQLFVHPEDAPMVAVEIQKALETTDPHFSRQLEHRIIYADGEIGYIAVRFFIVKDDQGRTVKTYGANQDITERKRAEEKLRESEERYRDLFDNASDLIQSVDEKGRFVYVNKKWKEVLGYSDEEIKKLNLTDILRKDQIPHCMELFKKVVSGETLDNVEVVFVTKEGREIFASGFVNPWMKDGKFVATRAIFSDVTGRKRTEQALIEAKEQAEEANRLKSEFLANMSHEIRTPMNAIIGMTGITLDTDLTDDQRESLNMVKESAYALLGLLDGILDLSKIEAGRVEFETIDFDLRVTVEGIADTLAHRASTKGLELACMIHHRVPTLLRGDPGRLRQILMNLGGNAVKFTEKGEVVIRVELSEETEDQATLLFSVTDTGIGIPKDKQEKIFESFTQADGSSTRKYGGTGLGLSISKQLVKLLDGQIGVESQPGKGSRFWFTISFEKQKEFKRISPVIPSDICGMRILVIDDNQANRSILVKMLESSGCSSEAVGSGNEAIRVLKRAVRNEKLFDLVLLDMQMPEMDGEQTLRAIKADPELKDALVVILTSIGIRGDVARLEALGCAGYLTKPIKQSQLFDTIITMRSQQKTVAKEKSLGSMGPSTIVTRHTIEEQKRQKVRILVAEDNPMNQKLAVTLLKKAGYWVDAVEDGRMVIEAVKRRAYDLILMDVQMPEMDGFEATKIIRKMEGEARRTAIIAMTAHAMKGDRERCLQAGMDGYISKPIATQELFDTINKWTKSYDEKKVSSQQEMFKKCAQPKDIPTGSEHVKPIDLGVALNRFGGDKEFFKEMVDEFLNYAPKQLEILTKAIERGDAKVVEREAHSIKGASGNLGAKHLADLSLQLELLGRTKDLAGAEEIIDNLKRELKHLEENVSQSLKEEIILKP